MTRAVNESGDFFLLYWNGYEPIINRSRSLLTEAIVNPAVRDMQGYIDQSETRAWKASPIGPQGPPRLLISTRSPARGLYTTADLVLTFRLAASSENKKYATYVKQSNVTTS